MAKHGLVRYGSAYRGLSSQGLFMLSIVLSHPTRSEGN